MGYKHYFTEIEIKDEIKKAGFKLEELKLDDPQNSFSILSYT
jgi:hypothetical protein